MADRYWVGGTGTWNSSSTTNWSATSGGASGASAPTSADNVIINSASGSSGMVITIGSGAVCNDFTQTLIGYSWTLGGNSAWSIYGSVAFDNTNCTASYNGTLTFAATSTGKTINGGTQLIFPTSSALVFNGVGGGWTLTSEISYGLINGPTVTITNGSFNTGNFDILVNALLSTTAGTRTISFGSSTVMLRSNFQFANTAGLTFNRGTSTIGMTGPTAVGSNTFYGGGQTFYDVYFDNTSPSNYTRTITGANTFRNLTFDDSSGSAQVLKFTITDPLTVTGTLLISNGGGGAIDRKQVNSATEGTAVTITAAAATVSYVDFLDITIAGAAAPISGTSIGNCGNNSGITFTAAKTVYWNLAGTQVWSQGWAATSGGSPSTNNYPLPQDTAVFNNSGSVGTVTFERDANISNVDASSCTASFTVNGASFPPTCRGNWSSGINMSFATTTQLLVENRSQKTFTFPSSNTVSSIRVTSPGGGMTLGNNCTTGLNSTSSFILYAGTLNLAGFTLSTYGFQTANTTAKTITFGGGTVLLTGNSAVILTLSASTSEVLPTITDAGVFNSTSTTTSGTRTFVVGNATNQATEANAPSVSVSAGSGAVSLFASANYRWKNLNLTGFTGSLTASSAASTIYGSITLGSGMTLSSYTGAMSLAATSGTQIITSNGGTFSCPISIDGIGGTRQLADAFLSSTSVGLTGGTLNTNGYSVTSSGFTATTSNVRTLTFGATTWTITGAGSNAWNCVDATNLTVNRGTSTVNMTSASLKYFFPGGKTWGAINQGGSGTLQITGSVGATFANLTNTVQPATIQFVESAVNPYFFDAFSISGTAGNLVTLSSTTNGQKFTLSKVGGGIVGCDYLSIRDSTATGSGAAWYAGANSTNVSNNTGWIFTAAPTGGGMLFFFN